MAMKPFTPNIKTFVMLIPYLARIRTERKVRKSGWTRAHESWATGLPNLHPVCGVQVHFVALFALKGFMKEISVHHLLIDACLG